MKRYNSIIQIFIAYTVLFIGANAYANDDDDLDFKDKVLAKVGQVKIKREHCNAKTYACDYVVYDAKGKKNILIEDWSRTAKAYQFNSQLMGFLFGATGSGYILTVFDAQNKQKEYANFEAMNSTQTCMVTFEKGLNKMPDSLVFYSIPDFRVRLALNKKVPQFKNLSEPSAVYFEDNGDLAFNYSYPIDGELGIDNVLIQKPCQSDYRIIMN